MLLHVHAAQIAVVATTSHAVPGLGIFLSGSSLCRRMQEQEESWLDEANLECRRSDCRRTVASIWHQPLDKQRRWTASTLSFKLRRHRTRFLDRKLLPAVRASDSSTVCAEDSTRMHMYFYSEQSLDR
jgi:hypothetical protein